MRWVMSLLKKVCITRNLLTVQPLILKSIKQHVDEFTPELAEELTGVPADDIREVARLYATAEKAIICWTLGITEHMKGTENVFSLINLALINRSYWKIWFRG